MQNAWRFVKDKALRERLKEAKGIGTPAARAEIINGLKRQNLLAADGKLVVPTVERTPFVAHFPRCLTGRKQLRSSN